MKKIVLFFLLFSHFVLANEIDLSDLSSNNIVNVITGNLAFEETDLIVPGIEPLQLQRQYISGLGKSEKGGWSFLRHALIYYNQDNSQKNKDPITVYEPSGLAITFEYQGKEELNLTEGKKHQHFIYAPKIGKNTLGASNSQQEEISGKTNLKNHRLKTKVYDKYIVISTGDGTKRYYENIGNCEHRISWEEKPNGNKIFYTWNCNGEIKRIHSTNHSAEKTYAFMQFHYSGENDFWVETSNGKKIRFRYLTKRKDSRSQIPFARSIHTYHLRKVYDGEKLTEFINYQDPFLENSGILLKNRKILGTTAFEIDYYNHRNNPLPNGESFFIPSKSDGRIGRVKTLQKALGQNGALVTTHIFRYFPGEKVRLNGLSIPGRTEIEEANGLQTTYHYDEKLRVKEIQTIDKSSGSPFLIFTQKFESSEDGTLLSTTQIDGTGNLLSKREFTYDTKGNVLSENLHANFTGKCFDIYKKKFTYSQDGFNLLLSQEEENGLSYQYAYVPGTNLPTAKYVLDHGVIRKRIFFEYNSDLILIKEMTDDGSSFESNNLGSVTERHIKVYYPKTEDPARSFPQAIEEKYLILETGEEKLLKKIYLHYSLDCKVTQKDVYDENNTLRYSLYYLYDQKGNLIEETSPLGEKTVYQYNDQNRLTYEKKGSSPNAKHFEYDAAGRILHEIEVDPHGKRKVTTKFYDIKGKCILAVDPLGNKTHRKYDVLGRCTLERSSELSDDRGNIYTPVVSSTYDALGNPISFTNSLDETTHYEYNFYSKPTHIKRADGTSITNHYDLNGNLQKTFLEDGSSCEYTYDFLGRMVNKTLYSSNNENLASEEWSYSTFHLLSHSSSNGTVTKFSYDAAGRKKAESQINQEASRNIAYSYDAQGFLCRKTLDQGNAFVMLYDIEGKLLEEKEINPQGEIISHIAYSYDTFGNRTEICRLTSVGFSTEYFSYDFENRPIKHVNPLGHTTLFSYTDMQKVTTDALGNKFIETFDALNRLTKVEKTNPWDASLTSTEFYYDRKNHKTRETTSIYLQGKLLRTFSLSWKYDIQGKVLEEVENNEKVTTFSYDPKGRLIQTTKPGSTQISYRYDFLDRITEITCSDHSIHYRYFYEDSGKTVRIEDLINGNTFLRATNGFGNIIQEKQNDITLCFSYDSLGRKSQIILHDYSSIDYLYDSSHLKEIHRKSPSGVTLYTYVYSSYDPLGASTQEQLPFDLGVLSRKTDSLGRITQISTNFLQHVIHSFDALGNPLSTNHSLFGATNYSYDSLSQLQSENKTSYLHDSLGNRQQKDSDTYEINSLNQITSNSCSHFIYDPNGYLTQKETEGTLLLYEYDAFGRLTAITEPQHIRIEFQYDPWNRRIKKTLYRFQENTWQKHTELSYIYDGSSEIAALDSNFHIVELRVLGNGSDHGTAVAFELDSKPYIPIHDLFGNTSALIDPETRQIAEAYHYTAFGEISYFDPSLTPCAPILNTPWLYSSKRYDLETNLTYFGSRYYDPAMGRFLTPDPLGYADGSNTYAFVHNNPIVNFDPTGLFSVGGFNVQFELHIGPQHAALPINVTPFVLKGVALTSFISGSALEIIGTHCLPDIPVLRQGVIMLGKLIKLDLGYKVQEQFRSEIKSFSANPNRRITYINGMMNLHGSESFNSLEHMIRDFDCDAETIYTESTGFIDDLIDTILLRIGIETQNACIAYQRLKNIIDKSSPDTKHLIVAHSKGALLADYAIRRLGESYQDRIDVIAVGPAMILQRDLASYVLNLTSKNDPIPFIGDFFHMFQKVTIKNQPHIQMLESEGTFFDHSIDSPTYQKELRNRIKRFLNN